LHLLTTGPQPTEEQGRGHNAIRITSAKERNRDSIKAKALTETWSCAVKNPENLARTR
jgi:hypothetical protein